MGKKRFFLVLILILGIFLLVKPAESIYGVCFYNDTGRCSAGVLEKGCSPPNLFYPGYNLSQVGLCTEGCCCYTQAITTETSCAGYYQRNPTGNEFFPGNTNCDSVCAQKIPSCSYNFCQRNNSQQCWCGNTLAQAGDYCCMQDNFANPTEDRCLASPSCNLIIGSFNVTGYVKNSSNQPINNATVYSSGLTTKTNSSGYYSLDYVPLGIRIISAYADGYEMNSTTVTQNTPTIITQDFVLQSSTQQAPQCQPEDNASFCSSNGKQCGLVTGKDKCGHDRTVNCGNCPEGQTCSNGKCSGTPPPTCTDGQKTCQDRTTKLICENSQWKTVSCTEGYFCKNGDCILDNCTNNGYFCCLPEQGIGNPLSYSCPNGQSCYSNQCGTLPPPTTTLTVNVFDNNNAPLSDVNVILSNLTLYYHDAKNTGTGNSAVFNTYFGGYTITAAKTGYRQASKNVLLNSAQHTESITLAPRAVYNNIYGTIKERTGSAPPLPGAKVVISGYTTQTNYTDQNGNYRFDGITESDYNYTITASKEGYETNFISVDIKQSNKKIDDITLEPLEACTLTQNPAITLNAVRGSHNIIVSWAGPICVSRYDLYRNGILLKSGVATPYIDNSTKQPNTDYEYKIVAINQDQQTEDTKTIRTGDLECMNGLNEFCSSGSPPWFNNELTFTSKCNDTNNIITFNSGEGIPANCSQIFDPNTNTYGRYTCLVIDGQARCTYRSRCAECNTPLGMFGFNGTALFADNGLTGGMLTQYSCFNIPYCFFNKKSTPVDMHDECSQVKSCYDYKSENSCNNNKCLNHTPCIWNSAPSAFSELGIGVCAPVNESLQNCSLCNQFSKAADNAVFGTCNANLCSLYGNCYYGNANPASKEMRCIHKRDLTCYNYIDEKNCQNNTPVKLNAEYNSTGSRVSGTNTINPSSDSKNLGLCKWGPAPNNQYRCFKDADNYTNREHSVLNYSDCLYPDLTCQKDMTPPETTLLTDKYKVKDLNITLITSEPVYKTFACVGNCYPTTEISDGIIDTELQSYLVDGKNKIRAYSEDLAHNIETPIKEIEIEYVGTGINITTKWTILKKYNETRTADIQINFSTSRQATCNASLKNIQNNANINPEKNILNAIGNKWSIIYEELAEGRYVYNISCSDDVGYSASKTLNINLDLDPGISNPQPDTTINYNQNIEISIDTYQNGYCKYQQVENFAGVPQGEYDCSNFAIPKDGEQNACDYFDSMLQFTNTNSTHHTQIINSSEINKTLKFAVACRFTIGSGINPKQITKFGSLPDFPIFSIDMQAPQLLKLKSSFSSLTDFADLNGWYNAISFRLVCVDGEIENPTGEFGCKEIKFCSTKGNSCIPQTVQTQDYNNYMTYRILPETIGDNRTICYSASDNGNNMLNQNCSLIRVDTTNPVIEDLVYPNETSNSSASISGNIGNYLFNNLNPNTFTTYYLNDYTINAIFNYSFGTSQGLNELEAVKLGYKNANDYYSLVFEENKIILLKNNNQIKSCDYNFANKQDSKIKIIYNNSNAIININGADICNITNQDLSGDVFFNESSNDYASLDFKKITVKENSLVSPITKILINNTNNNEIREIDSSTESIESFEGIIPLESSPTNYVENYITITATDAAGNTGSSIAVIKSLDSTGPNVAITSPADGYETNSSVITVNGTVDASDLHSLRIIVNGEKVISLTPNPVFSSEVYLLREGMNEIKAEATDNAGNIGYARIEVNYTNIGPNVSIEITPRSGAYLSISNISARFTDYGTGIDEENLSIEKSSLNTSQKLGPLWKIVAGDTIKSGNNPYWINFTPSNMLTQTGDYKTIVEPVAKNGEIGLIKREDYYIDAEQIIVNYTNPQCTNHPCYYKTNQQTMKFEGILYSDVEIIEANLSLNGENKTLTLTNNPDGTKTFNSSNLQLSEGSNIFYVYGVKSNGIIKREIFDNIINKDTTGPSIDIIAPKNTRISVPKTEIIIHTDENALCNASCKKGDLYCGTYNFTANNSNNHHNLSISESTITGAGTYRFTISCKDEYMNEGTEILDITYDTTNPSIINFNITPSIFLNENPFGTRNYKVFWAWPTIYAQTDEYSTCNISTDNFVTSSQMITSNNLLFTSDIGSLTNGNYTWYIKCTDLSGLISDTKIIKAEVCTNCPIYIFNNYPNISTNQNPTNISFETDTNANCKIESSSCGAYSCGWENTITFNNPSRLFVSQQQVNLNEGVNYSVTLRCNDTNNIRADGYLTFNFTLDTTPPAIKITSPKDGSMSQLQDITVTGTTAGEAGINISIKVICENIINPQGSTISTTSGFSMPISLICNGWNTIYAEGRDAAGNTNSTSVNVWLNLTDYGITIEPTGTKKNLTIINATFANLYTGDPRELSLDDSYMELINKSNSEPISLTKVCPRTGGQPRSVEKIPVENCPTNMLIYSTLAPLKTEGIYQIKATPISKQGKKGLTKSEDIQIDPNAPEITAIFTPEGVTSNTSQNALVIVNPTDSIVYLNLTFGSSTTRFNGQLQSDGKFAIPFTLSNEGTYYYKIFASKNNYLSSLPKTYEIELKTTGPPVNESGINITKRP